MPGFVPEKIPESAIPRRPLDARLSPFLIWAILLLTAAFTFLDYWAYSRVEHADPLSWQQLASGQGIAPAQYRVGVYYTARFFAHLTHLQFRHIFAASDLFCTGFSLAVLFFLLTRSFSFRERGVQTQWAMALLALLLTQFYLGWTLWFQEPETMPSLAILAASSLLCSGFVRVPRIMLALSLVLVAVLGSTIRVDVVIALHAGLLLAALVTPTSSIPLGKGWQVGVSLVSLAIAGGIEHYLAHTIFPFATRDAALFQLVTNLRACNGSLVLLFSLPPWALTVWLAWKYRSAPEWLGAGTAPRLASSTLRCFSPSVCPRRSASFFPLP